MAPNVSLTISPGSRQVLKAWPPTARWRRMVTAGARMLECACGPCIGMGQAPATDAVSACAPSTATSTGAAARPSANVYLVSPETAAVSAVTGVLTDPETSTAAAHTTCPSTLRSTTACS